MENPFSEGDKVVCVSTDFKWIEKYGGVGEECPTPFKGEVLTIDEILGEFLRFDKYDTEASLNWWHHTRFAPVTELDLMALELMYDYNCAD